MPAAEPPAPAGSDRRGSAGVHAYEWAVLRVVPRVERGEFVNAGVLVHCRALDWLGAQVALPEERALALHPALDVEAVRRHLAALAAAATGQAAHPLAARSPSERFRWLTAPRSTVVQPSPVHTGLTADPAAELARLLDTMVL